MMNLQAGIICGTGSFQPGSKLSLVPDQDKFYILVPGDRSNRCRNNNAGTKIAAHCIKRNRDSFTHGVRVMCRDKDRLLRQIPRVLWKFSTPRVLDIIAVLYSVGQSVQILADNLAATIKTIRTDMMSKMRLTGCRLNGKRACT